MKELTLRQIKQIELDILLFFKAFCEANQLRYYLSNGTLLGAVKYKGFIPWDDDIDVFMPREDYDRFVERFPNTDIYTLFSNERCPEFAFPFAKLCDTRTLKDEIGADNGVKLGLDIDIFPLDAWDVSLKKAKTEVRKIQGYLRKISFAKLPFRKGKKPIRTVLKLTALCVAKCIGPKAYVRVIQKRVCKNSAYATRKYMGCFVWPIYGVHEIIPAEVFDSTVSVDFAGNTFPAPAGYDTYLRSLYGVYEKDPPPDKQKTHHRFKAYGL